MSAIEETRAVDVAGKDTRAGGGQPSGDVGGVHPARGLADQVLARLRRGALTLPRGPRPGQPWTPRTEAERHLLAEGRRLDRARQQLLAEVGRLRHELGARGGGHEGETVPLRRQEAAPQADCPLTAPQLTALVSAARGEKLQETAERLQIPYETVRTRRNRAISQTGARSMAHAVAIAVAAGWVSPDQHGGGEQR